VDAARPLSLVNL
jgi:hypothetical protein